MTDARLVLASGSAIRAAILKAARLNFVIMRPDVDEESIKRERTAAGAGLEETAAALADAKALAVCAPGAFVVGSDQILEHRGRAHDKPRSMIEAAGRLLAMQGEAHSLINAVTVAKDGEIVFRHLDRPKLFMRAMTPDEIARYLDAAGEDVLSSVGAYQLESLGAHLFDRVEGDHFAVLGLSLFPLLAFLREEGVGAF